MNHYDLGSIVNNLPNRKLAGRRCRRKKTGLELEEINKRLGSSKAPFIE
jgi:hypothetical protein